ncbi:MAG: hypothetical protein RHS_1411 [Robinsoniella sp. RHS]|nr:MAG: hypothetical protein RHS_1411 [Robinsoniella sp. RHS]
MKNKFRSQDQLLYANRVRHATTPGPHPAEKTSFVSINCIPEREGGRTRTLVWEAYSRAEHLLTFPECFLADTIRLAPIGL